MVYATLFVAGVALGCGGLADQPILHFGREIVKGIGLFCPTPSG